MLEQPLLFTSFSSIQFFNIPFFPNTVNQDTFGTLPLLVQYLCDIQDALLQHWSPSTSHPTLPKEAESFCRGVKDPQDVPLPTF